MNYFTQIVQICYIIGKVNRQVNALQSEKSDALRTFPFLSRRDEVVSVKEKGEFRKSGNQAHRRRTLS
jgi:hypothetical protein